VIIDSKSRGVFSTASFYIKRWNDVCVCVHYASLVQEVVELRSQFMNVSIKKLDFFELSLALLVYKCDQLINNISAIMCQMYGSGLNKN
jgi:hypothetical protein